MSICIPTIIRCPIASSVATAAKCNDQEQPFEFVFQAEAVTALRWVAAAVLCDVSFVTLTCGVLTGLGDTTTTAICRCIMLVIVFPFAWWLGVHRQGGIEGLWQGWVIGIGTVAFFAIWVTFRADWDAAVALAQDRAEDDVVCDKHDELLKDGDQDSALSENNALSTDLESSCDEVIRGNSDVEDGS